MRRLSRRKLELDQWRVDVAVVVVAVVVFVSEVMTRPSREWHSRRDLKLEESGFHHDPMEQFVAYMRFYMISSFVKKK